MTRIEQLKPEGHITPSETQVFLLTPKQKKYSVAIASIGRVCTFYFEVQQS